MYTLLTLKQTFIAFIVLSMIQFLAIFTAKIWTSSDFRKENYRTNMLIHVFENLNYASPFKDWDETENRSTLSKLKDRFMDLKKEMILIFFVNGVFTLLLLMPLWYTGKC